MGQVWQILNLDAKQTYGSWGKLGEFFFSGWAEVLVSDLRRPGKVSFTKIIGATRAAHATRPKGSHDAEAWIPVGKSLLDDVPVEVIRLLFVSIDDLRDAISFGLTCKHLLQLGLDRIDRLLAASTIQWAGGRIACVGGYEANKDIDDRVLTPAEKAILEERNISLFEYGESFKDVDENRLSSILNDSTFTDRLSWVELKQYKAILRKENTPAKGVVLCNLSKREYIRQEATEEHGRAGLGTFLLSRICWSNDWSTSMNYQELWHGTWAGDRFEVTTIDALRGGVDEWDDVSEEVGDEMAEIWECEYGSNWKENCD